MTEEKIKIGIVDDHTLFRKGIVELINGNEKYVVVIEAGNGEELLERLKNIPVHPEVILMDIDMPKMNGVQTAAMIRQLYKEIRMLALSMYDQELSIIRMLRNGANGYLLKDSEPRELFQALQEIICKGFYHSELTGNVLLRKVQDNHSNPLNPDELSEKEIVFLRLSCSEMTYKEIADQMILSPRTIDGYREALFEKLNIKSRVGLVLYALRNGIVKLN